MILVTGATGHFGKLAIEFLLTAKPASRIAALVRKKEKAAGLTAKGIEVRVGDYTDPVSLAKAFEGAEKLLFVSSSDINDRVGQHANVVNAAKDAGVKHIVYTSVLNPADKPYFEPAEDHKKTEELILNSGIAYTFLRHAFYFEVIPMLIGNVLESGKIFYPAGDGKLSNASRIDMAEAAAKVMTGSGHENKVYEIGSNSSFTFKDIASTLSDLSGKTIEYVDIPVETFKKELEKNQLPPAQVELYAGMANAISSGELNYPSSDLENLLGRRPFGLREYLKDAYFKETTVAV